jgi:hypothetical protein
MSRVIALALVAWILLPLQTPAPAVVVHGWVEDEGWEPVTDPSREDFDVLVDGVPVRLDSMPRRQGPASTVLMLDATRSTLWMPRPLDEQLGAFAASLGSEDRLMFASLGEKVTFSSFEPATRDIRDDVRRAIEDGSERGFGNSPVWDALHEAITRLAAQPEPRTILLLSDGRATGNERGLAEVADHAMANAVAINIILRHAPQRIRQGPKTAVLVQPGAPLEVLAEYTGGVLFYYPELQDDQARTRFTHLAASVRALHGFAFTPPVRDGRPHRLEIRSKRPGIRVHAPSAFIAR